MTRLVDDLLEDQRGRWLRANSVRGTVLVETPCLANDDEGIIDLVYHEFVLLAAQGPPPSPEEYFLVPPVS